MRASTSLEILGDIIIMDGSSIEASQLFGECQISDVVGGWWPNIRRSGFVFWYGSYKNRWSVEEAGERFDRRGHFLLAALIYSYCMCNSPTANQPQSPYSASPISVRTLLKRPLTELETVARESGWTIIIILWPRGASTTSSTSS